MFSSKKVLSIISLAFFIAGCGLASMITRDVSSAQFDPVIKEKFSGDPDISVVLINGGFKKFISGSDKNEDFDMPEQFGKIIDEAVNAYRSKLPSKKVTAYREKLPTKFGLGINAYDYSPVSGDPVIVISVSGELNYVEAEKDWMLKYSITHAVYDKKQQTMIGAINSFYLVSGTIKPKFMNVAQKGSKEGKPVWYLSDEMYNDVKTKFNSGIANYINKVIKNQQ